MTESLKRSPLGASIPAAGAESSPNKSKLLPRLQVPTRAPARVPAKVRRFIPHLDTARFGDAVLSFSHILIECRRQVSTNEARAGNNRREGASRGRRDSWNH